MYRSGQVIGAKRVQIKNVRTGREKREREEGEKTGGLVVTEEERKQNERERESEAVRYISVVQRPRNYNGRAERSFDNDFLNAGLRR